MSYYNKPAMYQGLEYKVHVPLRTRDVWNVKDRTNEVQSIRDWLDELTEWQEAYYAMQFYSSGSKLNVWFKLEEHATMCALRWA